MRSCLRGGILCKNGYFVEEWVCQGEMGERESLEVFCKGMSVLKEKWKKGI